VATNSRRGEPSTGSLARSRDGAGRAEEEEEEEEEKDGEKLENCPKSALIWEAEGLALTP